MFAVKVIVIQMRRLLQSVIMAVCQMVWNHRRRRGSILLAQDINYAILYDVRGSILLAQDINYAILYDVRGSILLAQDINYDILYDVRGSISLA